MRAINIEKIKSDLSDDWLERAEQHIQAMLPMNTQQRKAYIKANAAFWGEVREFFWRHGGKKCWYSERQLSFNESHLEHFRPKAKVAKENHPGYWWLAFNWRNYRIASSIVNTRKTEIRNKKVQGKGTYFPLIAGQRSQDYVPTRRDPLSVGNEVPELLDPINPNDVALLGYDYLNGKYEGKIDCDDDACLTQDDKTRVKRSIEYYQLNDGNLIDKRYERFVALEESCEVLEILSKLKDERELTANEVTEWRKHFKKVAEMISPDGEFSVMCRRALESLGNMGWNQKLLSSV